MGSNFGGAIPELSLAPKLTQSVNFASPVSHLPLIRYSTPLHSSKDFVQIQAAILLVGSFVFRGFCSSKPALGSNCSLSEAMFEKLLESEPENKEALVYKKTRRGKTEDAVKYVEKLMKLEPHEVEWKLLDVLVDIGLKPQGQFEECLKIFQPMVNDNPQRFSDLTFGLSPLPGHSLYSLMDKKEEAAPTV